MDRRSVLIANDDRLVVFGVGYLIVGENISAAIAVSNLPFG